MPIEPWWETNPATTPRQELGMVSLRQVSFGKEAETYTLLTVTDFGGLDVGIPQAMRRSIAFAANSRGTGAG